MNINEKQRVYLCIDLKSFYASVECADRGLDPFKTNLVVADPQRSDKTICLAVSPTMKALGVPGRCRLFEIPGNISYITARPRMQTYIDYSARVYEIYLKYIDKDDIHVYSIDEAFFDVTDYLVMYRMTARQLAETIMGDILDNLKLASACGIGTNLYLAKIALDITAKHSEGRIGYLDEELYLQTLWDHTPLTDFWRIGKGIASHLERLGIYTMRQLTYTDEKLLYKAFGIDAELLIDHAYGRETTTMADIKAYEPKSHSITSGQVLMCDYEYEKARLICAEMTDALSLDLVEKHMMTDLLSLYVGYSGKERLPSARGSVSLSFSTNSANIIGRNMDELFRRIVKADTMIRRLTIGFSNTISDENLQCDMFNPHEKLKEERQMMSAVVKIREKYGKNSILKAMDLEEGATTIERNMQIGGHKA